MPINENPSLPNRHTAYIAKSGGGKSQALKQNPAIPKRGARVLVWDPNNDHAKHCRVFPSGQLKQFHQAVVAGMNSRKGFRIGLSGDQSQDYFERYFARLAFACLDGNFPLYILVEEVAKVQRNSSVPSEFLSKLLDQSRKYNGQLHWTTQFPSQIPTDLMRGTEQFWIGNPGKFSTPEMEKRLSQVADCSPAQLKALKPLHFYVCDSEKSTLETLKYKNL